MSSHAIDLPDWAEARGAALNRFDAIDPARAALIVIDMQVAFVSAGAVFGNPHALAIIPAINRLAAAMRAAGGQVIWTRQTIAGKGPCAMPEWQYDAADPHTRRAIAALTPGAAEHRLHPDMAVDRDDLTIDKYRYGAFSCPAGALAAALEARRIGQLVIAGTLTNICCDSTAREANMRGYRVAIVPDATAAVTDAEHNAALLNLRIGFADVLPTARVAALLNG